MHEKDQTAQRPYQRLDFAAYEDIQANLEFKDAMTGTPYYSRYFFEIENFQATTHCTFDPRSGYWLRTRWD